LPDINVNISKKIFNPVYYPYLENDERYNIFIGGAGSVRLYFAARSICIEVSTKKVVSG